MRVRYVELADEEEVLEINGASLAQDPSRCLRRRRPCANKRTFN